MGNIYNFIFHAHVINVSDEFNLYSSAHKDNIKPKLKYIIALYTNGLFH